jgi:hypothetical protein
MFLSEKELKMWLSVRALAHTRHWVQYSAPEERRERETEGGREEEKTEY